METKRYKKNTFIFISQEIEFSQRKKLKQCFYLNLVTKYQDYGMETFYFLKMYIGVYLYKIFVGQTA